MERAGSGIVVRSGGSIGVSACFRVPGRTGSSGTDRQWREYELLAGFGRGSPCPKTVAFWCPDRCRSV